MSHLVPTKASMLTKRAFDYEEVTFASSRPKKYHKDTENADTDDTPLKENEPTVKRLKHEVVKLGMSGFDSSKREEAKIQQLIKLGAKPPKNKSKNYKELMLEKKMEKKKLEAQQKLQQLGKNEAGKSTAKGKSFDRKRRKRDGLLEMYGTVSKRPRK
ncbi:uncharacterized protein LOC132701852 [Cylas formicarius]|uniref:uncharacterized protein LOC132701852 n=1 Tax=Cylas formicarius TaxID=197179 RepID=UPI0029587D34|nr:uncharacterized protein LOC132701852 [Cylas formicarius]